MNLKSCLIPTCVCSIIVGFFIYDVVSLVQTDVAERRNELLDRLTPPLTMELEEAEELKWSQPGPIAIAAAGLLEEGFVEAGKRFWQENTSLLGMTLSEQGIACLLTEEPQRFAVVNLLTHYEDGTWYTTSNSTVTHQKKPPSAQGQELDTDDVHTLIQSHLTNRPKSGILPADDMWSDLRLYYTQEMAFNIARGGPEDEEHRQLIIALGEEPTPELIQVLREGWERRIAQARQLDSQARQLDSAQTDETTTIE